MNTKRFTFSFFRFLSIWIFFNIFLANLLSILVIYILSFSNPESYHSSDYIPELKLLIGYLLLVSLFWFGASKLSKLIGKKYSTQNESTEGSDSDYRMFVIVLILLCSFELFTCVVYLLKYFVLNEIYYKENLTMGGVIQVLFTTVIATCFIIGRKKIINSITRLGTVNT